MTLKLFVWEDVLVDWTAGAMWALAETAEQARELIKAADPLAIEEDLAKEPKVYDRPVGFAVWGGG